jgi:hypothetical protein
MKERLASVVRTTILTMAVAALVAGVAEARSARKADECTYLAPFYLGACTSNEQCQQMCDPYWPEQNVGACLPAWICCICE